MLYQVNRWFMTKLHSQVHNTHWLVELLLNSLTCNMDKEFPCKQEDPVTFQELIHQIWTEAEALLQTEIQVLQETIIMAFEKFYYKTFIHNWNELQQE